MKELDKRYSDIITTNPGRLKSITTSMESNYKLKFYFDFELTCFSFETYVLHMSNVEIVETFNRFMKQKELSVHSYHSY